LPLIFLKVDGPSWIEKCGGNARKKRKIAEGETTEQYQRHYRYHRRRDLCPADRGGDTRIPCPSVLLRGGEPLRKGTLATGLEIIHTVDILWQFPGVTSGKIDILSDYAGNTISVQTRFFETDDARNAAILTYSAQGTGWERLPGTCSSLDMY